MASIYKLSSDSFYIWYTTRSNFRVFWAFNNSYLTRQNPTWKNSPSSQVLLILFLFDCLNNFLDLYGSLNIHEYQLVLICFQWIQAIHYLGKLFTVTFIEQTPSKRNSKIRFIIWAPDAKSKRFIPGMMTGFVLFNRRDHMRINKTANILYLSVAQTASIVLPEQRCQFFYSAN